jgi:hypothetical protein
MTRVRFPSPASIIGFWRRPPPGLPDVHGPLIFRQPEEHPANVFPEFFPQLLGEIPPLFTPKGWGKREHPAQKVPILRGFHGGRDRD